MGCNHKKPYRSIKHAREHVRRRGHRAQPYYCVTCRAWHLANPEKSSFLALGRSR